VLKTRKVPDTQFLFLTHTKKLCQASDWARARRGSWITGNVSQVFHKILPLEFHRMIVKGLEPCLGKIFMTRFQSPNRKQGSRLIKGGRCAFSVGRDRYIERQIESKKFSAKIWPIYGGQEHLDRSTESPYS